MKYATAIVALMLMGLQDPSKQEKVRLVPYRSDQPGAQVGAGMEAAQEEPASVKEIRAKLGSSKMSLDMAQGTVDDAIAQLKAATNLNFVTHQSVRDRGQINIDVQVRNLTVSTVLDLVTQQCELAWTVGDNFVLVTTRDDYRRRFSTLRTYDLRDLLFQIRDFPGPMMDLAVGTENGGLTGATFTTDEPSHMLSSEEAISELIKTTIDPGQWDGDVNTINMMSGVLFVRTQSENHAQIEKFVQRLRLRSQIQIRTETRVVAVTEELLAQVTKNGPALDAAAESALEDAMKKNTAQLLGAAELLCFNSQRTHAVRANQKSFVGSYDASIGGGTVAATPHQQILNDGVMLDVRPVAGADRRSVTLELRFSMTHLNAMASSVTAVGAVQQPDVLNYRLLTTITVPSSDSVVVGTLGDYMGVGETPKLRSILIVKSTILGLEQK